MGPASEALGAIGESVVFLAHFKDLPDPRQRGKIIYPLAEVLLLCLLAVLGGAETFVDTGQSIGWRDTQPPASPPAAPAPLLATPPCSPAQQ